MHRERKDRSLGCCESANWIRWSCSSSYHMEGQPRFLRLGNKTNAFHVAWMWQKKTDSSQMLYSHGFMVAFEDTWLNVFAKSFLFKKGKKGYFWEQQLPLKLFSDGFPFHWWLPVEVLWCATKMEFTVQWFHQRVSSTHSTQDILNLVKTG